MTTKLGGIRSKTIMAGSAAALDDALFAWIQENAGEKHLIESHFGYDGTNFVLVLIYAE